jgi:hypothetical protein
MNLKSRISMLRYDAYKLPEKITVAVAWKLPRPLAYWAAIRVMSHATVGKYGDQIVPELLAMDALKRWDDR